jgi:hypothetical protein
MDTLIRKRKHVRYVESYLRDVRYEIVNIVVSSNTIDKDTTKRLNSLGSLLKKYERRKRLLKF